MEEDGGRRNELTKEQRLCIDKQRRGQGRRGVRRKRGEQRDGKALEGGKKTQEELKSKTRHVRVKFLNKTGNENMKKLGS